MLIVPDSLAGITRRARSGRAATVGLGPLTGGLIITGERDDEYGTDERVAVAHRVSVSTTSIEWPPTSTPSGAHMTEPISLYSPTHGS